MGGWGVAVLLILGIAETGWLSFCMGCLSEVTGDVEKGDMEKRDAEWGAVV